MGETPKEFLDAMNSIMSAQRENRQAQRMSEAASKKDELARGMGNIFGDIVPSDWLSSMTYEEKTPLEQAQDTYPNALQLTKDRSRKFYEDEVGKGIPKEIYRALPSMETEDLNKKILTGEHVRTIEGIAGKTVGDESIEPPIGIIYEGGVSQDTRDHEFTHALNFLRELRPETDREEEGISTGWFQGLRLPKGYKAELSRLESSEFESERAQAIGFEKVHGKSGEGVAYLVAASRVFGRSKRRPPKTEEEVLEALDLAIDRAAKANNWISVGAYEGLKRLPWARKVGQYLVENRSPDEGGMKYV